MKGNCVVGVRAHKAWRRATFRGAQRGPRWRWRRPGPGPGPLAFSRARLACLISAGASLHDKHVYLRRANIRPSDNMRCCFPNEDTGALTKAGRVPQPQTDRQHKAFLPKDTLYAKSTTQHALFRQPLLKTRSLVIKKIKERRWKCISPLKMYLWSTGRRKEDVYRMIKSFPAHCYHVSPTQIKEFWRWLQPGTKLFLCITTKHQGLAGLLIPTS